MNNGSDTVTKAFITDSSMDWEQVAPGMKRKIMAYDNRVMLVKVAFEKGAVGTLHHHMHTQVSYVASGAFEVEIDGNKQVLKQGDTFFVEPDLVHGAVCIEPGELIDIFSPMREDFIS
jgi:quercetin dioxygenase-like cupin family protein